MGKSKANHIRPPTDQGLWNPPMDMDLIAGGELMFPYFGSIYSDFYSLGDFSRTQRKSLEIQTGRV